MQHTLKGQAKGIVAFKLQYKNQKEKNNLWQQKKTRTNVEILLQRHIMINAFFQF
jgi:hypothetical protein